MVKKKNDITYFEGIGRRRTAVARVRLYLVDSKKELIVQGIKIKKGNIFINALEITTLFPHEYQKNTYQKPFIVTDSLERFGVYAKIKGGGMTSQLEAFVHGVSRALLKVDESSRGSLKKEGLLTRDSRVRERRKVGTGGRARRKKQSPKR